MLSALAIIAVALCAMPSPAAAQPPYASPTIVWANQTNPFNTPVYSYGLPCVHAASRTVVFPVVTAGPATSALAKNTFAAFDVDTGALLWTYGFYSFGGKNNYLAGLYCAASQRRGVVYLAGGLDVHAVTVKTGFRLWDYSLPALSPSVPAPRSGPIVVVGSAPAQLYVTYGGAIHVLSENGALIFKVGKQVLQHIGAFSSGFFYYNDLLADGRTGLIAASTQDGSTVWQTFANSESAVATASVVTTATFNTNPYSARAYSAATGKKLWETLDFLDYDAAEGHFVGVYPANISNENDVNWTFTGRDLATGVRTWSTTVPLTAPPTVMGAGYVFTHGHGIAGGGYVTAVRVRDGSVAWQFTAMKGCTAYNGVTFEDKFFTGLTGACSTGNGVFALQI